MSQLQSILFNKDQYNLSQARRWLGSHNKNPLKFHITKKYIRARLHNPNYNVNKYRTENLGNDIKAIVQIPLSPRRTKSRAKPQRVHHGGDLLSFVMSNPNLINGLVGGIHALGSLAALGGIGYAIKSKLKK